MLQHKLYNECTTDQKSTSNPQQLSYIHGVHSKFTKNESLQQIQRVLLYDLLSNKFRFWRNDFVSAFSF